MVEDRVSMNTPLVLVDGHNLLWRAAFGFPAKIRNRRGDDLTPVFGFFALLRKALQEIQSPSECVVCFDGQHGANSRKDLDPLYKGQREIGEENPLKFLSEIKMGLDRFNVGWIEFDEHEADDVIATIVARESQKLIYIMSTDRDYYRLVTDRVLILNTARKSGKRCIGVDDIRDRYGVSPEQWCFFRALTGDPSDGIPGIKGVGPKRASALLSSSKNLDFLYSDEEPRTPLGRVLSEKREQVLRNLALLEFRTVDRITLGSNRKPVEIPTPAKVVEALGLW
jgi:DNA polymerase-1